MSEPQTQLTLKNGARIQISRSKLDDLLIEFSSPSMQAYKISEEIAQNSIGRCLFFCRSNLNFSIMGASQINVVLRVPLLLDYDYDLIYYLQRDDIKRKQEAIKRDLKKYQERLNDFGWSLTRRIFRTIFTDQRLINAIRTGNPEIIKGTLERVVRPRKKEILEMIREGAKIYPAISELASLERILAYTSIARDAQSNSRAFKLFVDLKNNPDALFDALRRLANLMQMRIESFCLDCVYRKADLNPYFALVENPKNVKLDSECPKCNGKGLIHQLNIILPFEISQLIFPQPRLPLKFDWFNEVLVGFVATKLNFIDSVFVHKKVHLIKNGKVQKGAEVDVTLITENGSLILIEVTRQHNLDNIMNEITRKIERFNNLNIPYSLLFYVTGHEHEHIIPLYGGKVSVLGIKHIYKLEDFLRHSLKTLEK